jgi:redox-sensitive bicupin YhaK (pirin superfamily)
MRQVRTTERILTAYATVEGAGVRLHRAFGYYEVPQFDPFLMLDDFRAPRPEDYLAGFPDHPHRGIETVTYMLDGAIEHGDSIGNHGCINGGDVQWMTAGSGIIHSEMPRPVNGRMGGFQLWVNLPAKNKMIPPRYQEFRAAEIPTISPRPGVNIRVICGTVNGVSGPVRDIVSNPQFLDVTLGPDTFFTHPVGNGRNAFAYVFGGDGTFDADEGHHVQNRDCVLFSDGPSIWVRSFGSGMRFLFLAGDPIGEPVAWRGPVVMNTREELRTAFREYEDGTFIQKRAR